MNYLLSFPRSGNTWIRYCLETLTERPTLGVRVGSHYLDRPMNQRTDIKISNNIPILRKEHYWRYLEQDKIDKVVMVIRDPKECFVSHALRRVKQETSIEDMGIIYAGEIMENIVGFDNYKGKKHIIYYEYLMDKKIYTELKILLNFLEVSDKKLLPFIQNINFHRKNSKKVYYAPNVPKQKMSNEIYEMWFNEMEKYDKENKDLVNKYFKKYRI